MPYSSSLTGEQIDNALRIARSIGQSSGVPIGFGSGRVGAKELDAVLDSTANGIPTSAAVLAFVSKTLNSFLRFAGTADTADELPETGQIGDVWHVSTTGGNFAWDGTGWADIGSISILDVTAESIGAIPNDPGAITANLIAADAVRIRETNAVIPIDAWENTVSYADFPYRASVQINGATSDMIPDVVYAMADAIGGNYAPIASTYDGGVYLYARAIPDALLAIPVITLWR